MREAPMEWLLIGLVSVGLLGFLGFRLYRERGRDAYDERTAAQVNADLERQKENWY
jgi:hypothetical protein